MAENFFSILKSECIYRQKIATFQQANDLIVDFINFYNHFRIQLRKKLTPLEKRRQSAESFDILSQGVLFSVHYFGGTA